jgi:prolyl oligopeptidase PreP (S9A serine peptidase family)
MTDSLESSEFLVKEKYAAPGKVAINGGSNGGLSEFSNRLDLLPPK